MRVTRSRGAELSAGGGASPTRATRTNAASALAAKGAEKPPSASSSRAGPTANTATGRATRSTRSQRAGDATPTELSILVGPPMSTNDAAATVRNNQNASSAASNFKKRGAFVSRGALSPIVADADALGLKRPRPRVGGSTASFATEFDMPGDLSSPMRSVSPIGREVVQQRVQPPGFSSSSSLPLSASGSVVSKNETAQNFMGWPPHPSSTEFVMRTPLKSDGGGIQGFDTCLDSLDEYESPLLESASKMSRSIVLQRALSIEELDDNSWLTSTLIDLVFTRFARRYPEVDFLAIDFAMLSLSSPNPSDMLEATDILGRKLQYDAKRPMIMLYNSKNIHWILMRVQQSPYPELQLFEPMGQPNHRRRPMSFRIVPREVVRWLDACCPIEGGKISWLAHTRSAITTQQQFTSFDCGVACLLYAEKCGQGQTKEEIDNGTSQQDITAFRKNLQRFIHRMRFGQG